MERVTDTLDSIADVDTRSDMIRFFERVMSTSAQSLKEEQKLVAGTNLTKSFIIETNLKFPEDIISKDTRVRVDMRETRDRNLFHLTLSMKGQEKRKSQFLLDSKDSRFWIFHTLERSDFSRRLIHHLVRASLSRLDNIWLSRDFLVDFAANRSMSEFSAGFETEIPDSFQEEDYISKMSVRIWGTASRRALDTLRDSKLHSTIALRAVRARFVGDEDERGPYADERLSSNGVLSASGTSATIHVQTVSRVVEDYARIVREIESGTKDAESARDVEPHYLLFTKGSPDIKKLVESVYRNMHRLRIFGIPSRVTSNHYRIPAVDLHNGDKLDLELSPRGIRVVLWPHACGNTLLRLENRLQKYVNADIVRGTRDDL